MRSGHRFGAPPPRRNRARAAVLLTLATLVAIAAPALSQGTQRRFLGPDGMPLPFQEDASILAFLRDAPVIDSRPAPGGTSGALWLTLEDERGRARAAFRHVSETRRNILMGDREAYAGFYDSAMSEIAAYELAGMLGLDMIPPVAERRYEGKQGTIQLWIEGAMTEGDRSEDGVRPPNLARWRLQRTAMLVFDALVHNTDRNSGNSLIDRDWNLWMIDHTRTFQRPRGRVDFSDVGQVPDTLWLSLRALDGQLVRERLRHYVEPLQIIALLDRHATLIRHFERLIRERGREAVVLGRPND